MGGRPALAAPPLRFTKYFVCGRPPALGWVCVGSRAGGGRKCRPGTVAWGCVLVVWPLCHGRVCLCGPACRTFYNFVPLKNGADICERPTLALRLVFLLTGRCQGPSCGDAGACLQLGLWWPFSGHPSSIYYE